jgi:hypothetical protein
VIPASAVVGDTSSKNVIVIETFPAGGVGGAFTDPRHASGEVASVPPSAPPPPVSHVFATQVADAKAAPRARQSDVVVHCLSSVCRRSEQAESERASALPAAARAGRFFAVKSRRPFISPQNSP